MSDAALPKPPAVPVAAGRIRWPRPAWHALLPLLLIDAVFLTLHVLHKLRVGPFLDASFSVTTESGHAEHFQYFKEFAIAAVLMGLAWRQRSAGHAAWALLFAYLMLDDSLSLHESAGAWLGEALQLAPAWGLRPIDLGELVLAALAGGPLLVLFAALMLRGRPSVRRLSRDLLLLLALLALCGVVLDMLHVVTLHKVRGVGLAEDGGEMLMMSLILACVARHASPAAAGRA